MNENNNRVNFTIPDEEYQNLLKLVDSLDLQLSPYSVGLTPQERMSLPKISVNNKDYVQDAIEQMKLPLAINIIPSYMNISDIENDLTVFNQLEQLIGRMENIIGKIDGTRILAGSEAYYTALTFKKLVETAEGSGISGAANIAKVLRERFKQSSKPRTDTDTDPADTLE